MKHRFSFLSSAAAFALFAAPLAAWAEANPDFDDDAKPILRMQPYLLQYVRASFDVKDTGIAKFPGDDDHAPRPPFIFRARPLGSTGPFNLRLMIQPGPPGHILAVVDITKIHAPPPHPVASQPPVQQPAPTPAPPPPEPASQASHAPPSQPTADTPSGPINSNGQVTPLPPPPPSTAPSLAPPPDPAPEPGK